jgi:outer membrane receptor protein involved in Fe transport
VHHRLIGLLATAALVPVSAMAQTPQKPEAQRPATKPPGSTVGEIVVTGQAPAVQTSIDRRSYSVATDLQAQTGSIGDALRNVPSVEVDVQGNVSLRGDPNVVIMIDGKPSGQFRGENKGEALQQLPADRIERVEVITNPSAEFRADGSAGIINLVTKKAKGAGQTGSARLTVGAAHRLTAAVSRGYNGKDLSLSGDAFYRHDTTKQVSEETRSRLDPAAAAFADTEQGIFTHVNVDLGSLRGSVDYDVDDRTRLSDEARGQYTDFALQALNDTQRYDAGGVLIQAFDRPIRVQSQRGAGELTGTLRRRFDGEGHELALSANYEATEDDRTRTGVNINRVPVRPDVFDRQHVLTSLRQAEIKGDYVRPMADGAKLKAGFAVQWDDNSYDNRGFQGLSAPASIPDPTLTNLFKFRQQLSAAYVTYERPLGDVTVLAGLRLEDARLDLNQATVGQKAENDYFRAYPSLHLSWKLTDTQQLTASYSHRVQRPQPDEFNAFRFLLDPVSYRAGNTTLKPQQTHSYELGWQYRKSPTVLLATAYYRENFDVVSDVVRDLGGGVFLTTRENVSESRSGGLELVANGRLTKRLTYNLSANGYWTELDSLGLGFSGKRSATTVSGRANLNWQLTPKDFVQVSGFLNSKRLTPQGYSKPTGMLNLGYRHKVGDRVSVLVTAQDVLGTYGERQVLDTPILKTRLKRDWDTRSMWVGVVWTFGGGKPRDPGFDFGQGGGAPTP